MKFLKFFELPKPKYEVLVRGLTSDNMGRRHAPANLLNYLRFSHIIVVIHVIIERIFLASNLGIKPTSIGVIVCDGECGQSGSLTYHLENLLFHFNSLIMFNKNTGNDSYRDIFFISNSSSSIVVLIRMFEQLHVHNFISE